MVPGGLHLVRYYAQATNHRGSQRRPSFRTGWISDSAEVNSGDSFVTKKPRRKIIQRPTPGLPFVGGSLRLDEDCFDASLLQLLVNGFHRLVNLRFGRASAEPKQPDLLVEGRRIGEDAAVGALEIKIPHRRAERTDVRKLVQ